MKKKLLASVVAGLGLVGSAHAVNVNPDGLGQVLLYPYYTVQNGFDTYVHVVNTTNKVKAVKVRFLEGKNSQEVLDFNLYLSPQDEWTGVLVQSANGTRLTTADTSCTAPAIPAAGVEFRDLLYRADSVNGLARTREGYIEIIEMGEVADLDLVAAATHVDGVPANCAIVRAAAQSTGVFNTDADAVTVPMGGLYGFNTLINVEGGLSTTVDAVAIDAFFTSLDTSEDLHAVPGDEAPSLEGAVAPAYVLNGNEVVTFNAANGIDAVSSVLMRTNVINDYVVAPEIAAMTDWVVTFPTKRFYVNGLGDVAPFAEKWDAEVSRSCDPISITYYDREEGSLTAGEDDFSPRPTAEGASLCNEVNTISIVPEGDTDSIFGAEFTNAQIELASGFTSGWMNIAFTGDNAVAGLSAGGVTVAGLPVIGFAATNFVNGTLQVDGVNVMSNYGGSSVHKGQRTIVTAP